MTNDWLTFELSGDGDEIEIHGDPEGLGRLVVALQRLILAKRSDHEHLATPEFSGSELSSEQQGDGTLIQQVTVRCWINSGSPRE